MVLRQREKIQKFSNGPERHTRLENYMSDKKEEKVIVLKKCKRCTLRPVQPKNSVCDLCFSELEELSSKENYDHYFWGYNISSRSETIYYVSIYHDCDGLDWLVGKNVKIDLKNSYKSGIIKSAKSTQDPPYRRGDLVAVTIE